MTPFLLLVPLGCTEYGFTSPNKLSEPDEDIIDTGVYGSAHQHVDTAETGDTGGSPPVETDTVDTVDTDVPDDPCYEPEDGYDLNPAARLVVYDANSTFTVTFLGSDSGYDDQLWVDAPVSTYLLDAWSTSPGATWTLGPYAVGTEIIFGAYITNTGDRWQTGPSSRNADNVVHGATTFEGDCKWQVGFEDLYGGGDLDFNDVIFRITGRLKQED